jgi:peptidoglycan/LPS O-acetylase OafA/YrhL
MQALTSLRFFAALIVMLRHYQSLIPYPPVFGTIVAEGRLGVSFFFVLSGFVLVYNYMSWFGHSVARAPVFFWHRAARIVPVYLLAHLLMTPVSLATLDRVRDLSASHSWPTLIVSWIANLLMVQALVPRPSLMLLWNDPGWSISTEMTFYVIFPIFVWRVLRPCSDRGWLAPLAMAIYLSELTLLALDVPLGHSEPTALAVRLAPFDEFLYKSPIFRVWEFLLGGVLGALLLSSRSGAADRWTALLQTARGRNVALGGALLALVALMFSSQLKGLQDYPNFAEWRWYGLVTPIWLLVIAALAWGPTFATRLLERPWLVRLGEASYGLYILHWIPFTLLMERVRHGHPPPLWLTLLVFVGTIIASLLCFSFFEAPSRRWLRAHIPALNPPRSAAAARASIEAPRPENS